MADILVVGDSCRDIFVYCTADRLAPDVPVPVLSVLHQTENAGMAANVQRNILKYKSCDLLTNTNWHEITKTRYVHDATNHMFVRVDNSCKVPRINLNDLVLDYKLVIISDYNKGFLTETDILHICKQHPLVFLDTKKLLGEWAEPAAFIKINDTEYKNSAAYMTSSMKDKIIHTMGDRGCEYLGKRYPVKKVDVRDISGAGDSFMAALCVKYLDTKDIVQSIEFANLCASEVVKHRGVTTI
jgi:D-beta-D-heptose 7-phosphate kinase/D-beta-D-heptose 1-phosphate adenosyltransferase